MLHNIEKILLLKILFGIYTRCQQMKVKVRCSKFECRKDTILRLNRGIRRFFERTSNHRFIVYFHCDYKFSFNLAPLFQEHRSKFGKCLLSNPLKLLSFCVSLLRSNHVVYNFHIYIERILHVIYFSLQMDLF